MERGRLHTISGSFKKAGDDFDRAYLLSKKKCISYDITDALLALANLAYLEGKTERSLSLLKKTKPYLKRHSSFDLDFKFWRCKGNIFRIKGHYEDALDCYKKCYRQVNEKKEIRRKAVILNLIGLAYRGAHKYRDAVYHIKRANQIFERIGDIPAQGSCLGNIGLVYTFWDKTDDAIPYFQKAVVILKNTQSKGLLTSPLLNWGIALYEQEKYDEALQKWNEALVLIKEQGDLSAQSMLYNNIGYLLVKKKDFQAGLEYLNLALSMKKKLNLTGYLPSTYNGLAQAYYQLFLKAKRRSYFVQAEKNAKKAVVIARKFNNKHDFKIAKKILKKLRAAQI